jgi:hypothetical protein
MLSGDSQTLHMEFGARLDFSGLHMAQRCVCLRAETEEKKI